MVAVCLAWRVTRVVRLCSAICALMAVAALGCSSSRPAAGRAGKPVGAAVRTATPDAKLAAQRSVGASQPEYHLSKVGDVWEARTPIHEMVTRFVNGHAAIRAASGVEARLRASSVVCGQRRWTLERAVFARSATSAHRAEAQRRVGTALVTEWYVNGPLGLEQGFTFESNPCDGGPLRIELEVSGALASGTGQLRLADASGKGSLSYGHGFAEDAAGERRALLVKAERSDRISLTLQTDGARFPLTIDPLVANEEAKLTQSLGETSASFGRALALNGTTALFGDPDPQGGKVFVHVQAGSAWKLEQVLAPSDSSANDGFGSAVAISGDYAVIGASGAAYVFVRSAGAWTQQQKLTISGVTSLGRAVTISGTTLAVSASDSVYVFIRSGTTWTQQQKLQGAASGDDYGFSISLSGETLSVGAPYESTFTGAVYVYTRSGSSWSQQQKLTGAGAWMIFGKYLALSGDTLLIAAIPDMGVSQSYAYVRSAGTWSQQKQFDSTAIGYEITAVALDGNIGAISGFNGSFVALSRSGGAWTQTALATGGTSSRSIAVSPSSLLVGGGSSTATVYAFGSPGSWTQTQTFPDIVHESYAGFGRAVARSGDTILIGAPGHSATAHQAGAVYVYVRRASSWVLQAELNPSDPAALGQFGECVALEGDTALIGPYVFVRSGGTWTQQTKLLSSGYDGLGCSLDGNTAFVGRSAFIRSGSTWTTQSVAWPTDIPSDTYPVPGASVAVRKDTAVVSAPGYDGTFVNQGAAVVLGRTGGAWTVRATLLASDPVNQSAFGNAVALDGDTIAVGRTSSETAYVFRRDGATWKLEQKLDKPTGGGFEYAFGASVALRGDTLVVGAVFGAHIYTRSGGLWTYQLSLAPEDAAFGEAVALQEDSLLLGDFSGNAATLFHLQGLSGNACSTTSQCAAGYTCVDGMCCSTACDNSCAACSISAGGTKNGTCTPLATGSQAKPACTDTHLLCDGKSLDCPLNCSSDTGCTAGDYCTAAGRCEPKKSNGAACSPVADCKDPLTCGVCGSGFCADGYCCNSACGDSCDSCSASTGNTSNGLCGPRHAGPGMPACADHLRCDGVSTACPTTCTTDEGCAPDYYCSGGSCQSRVTNGGACATTNQCAGGQTCVDGVCCSTPCTEPCGSCSVAGGGSVNGTCTSVASGTAGGCEGGVLCDGMTLACPGGCAKDTDCGSSQYCDARSKCVTKSTQGGACDPASDCFGGVSCGLCKTGFCVDGVCCDSACDGACDTCVKTGGAKYDGFCTTRAASSHGVPECDDQLLCDGQNVSCPKTCAANSYCSEGNYCEAEGSCVPRLKKGDPCSDTGACITGLSCVDGVCCNTECDGICESCAEPDHEGTCVAVDGDPRGDRPSCPGTPPCAGECNGTKRDGCSFADRATVCAPARCDNDSSVGESTCDGAGECAVGKTQDCGEFACNGDSGVCRTECMTSRDCKRGGVCDTSSGTGTCNSTEATCEGAFSVKSADGVVSFCEGYRCLNNACQQQCGKNNDCADGYVCRQRACIEGEGKVAAETPDGSSTEASSEDSGCGCRVVGFRSAGSATAASLGACLLALSFVSVRRRSRQRFRGGRMTASLRGR